ncbi:GAS8-like protein, putative [Plasmodium berghei]|uniref:GAS8-like protein, putative n=2 Tax=Plasmodium berghei TaxID=5821 RepID=A0A509AVI5_PLABA|nr:GAS8-like protein, putative [Plasmodium berghei ANKA]CXJ27336.1 GAS8-like protein, putative [Plasmodium berghei]SCM26990.1 GAS8-like protein, putative [Plasmodium berghei]SCN28739.1 GAS8-like protein, putative [Plasmodium berghei]SCO62998.1 GAS8-like protein, putative [Plasmodium berghei]SCO64486.1 GAS8-like protein, putative [Plasmodium berghei]|eukprot:XP_034424385.1 GAS8-like protein, putative [Plasmodium berghei ANKA]
MIKNKLKNKKKSRVKNNDNTLKKLSVEELGNLVKTKKEELNRTIQKKNLLEKKLDEKNDELETFSKEYTELKNKIELISKGCEEYDEKVNLEKKTIKIKSVFYNFQNSDQLKKLENEKENLKVLIDEKHEEAMNNLLNYIEDERINLDYVKNKNFNEINELKTSFDMKIKTIEEIFKKHLEEYDNDQKYEMEEIIDNYTIMEKNEIIYLKNLYNDHIKDISEIYMNMINDYKKYYFNQIRENITKIKLLKKQINELEANDKEAKSDINIYSTENLSMLENIKTLEINRENLNKALKFYSKDFVMYKNLELIYNENNVYIKNLKVFSHSFKEKILQVENAFIDLSKNENDGFDDYFENIKNKNMCLKNKIKSLNLNLESLDKELNLYIKEKGIKQEDVITVRKGIDFCMRTYNKEFDNLLYAQRKIKKKMKDSENIYEKKLKDINIKKEN